MNSKFIQDYKRFTRNDQYSRLAQFLRRLKNHELRLIYWGRKLESARFKLTGMFYVLVLHFYRKKYGVEINFKNVGGGLLLVHPWGITVNDEAMLGENVTLFKGCTIGVIATGSKAGCPKIGNNVVVCANATVVGNITVGDNSLIAGGAFVNFDVPSDSIVVGNPGVIHNRKRQ